jgi:hypothetical protein
MSFGKISTLSSTQSRRSSLRSMAHTNPAEPNSNPTASTMLPSKGMAVVVAPPCPVLSPPLQAAGSPPLVGLIRSGAVSGQRD